MLEVPLRKIGTKCLLSKITLTLANWSSKELVLGKEVWVLVMLIGLLSPLITPKALISHETKEGWAVAGQNNLILTHKCVAF